MAANKVFIVEDDAVIARAVAAHLTTWQMQVQCAGNFEKITEEVEDFQLDIIIMDIKLPYYNGFYWCAEIRKTSKVPIVFLSSADDNMNIVMAMNMGGDDFIAKPFSVSSAEIFTLPCFVYFNAFDKICSNAKQNHFSSVSTV